MHHNIPITKDILLTDIRKTDIQSIAHHINDKTIYNNTLKIPYPYSIHDADDFVNMVKAFETEHNIQKDWAIRIDGEMIGGIGLLYNYGIHSHRSEFGYWISPYYRNRGIMRKVIESFVAYCFDYLKMIRVEAHVFTENTASIRVLEKSGFIKEGKIIAAYIKDGKILDAYLFANISTSNYP